ncbi:MAG: pyridoxamine 5'-phosphate oxidase family protein [Lachnospiraceae bacterium]|nr:pyridoxamine 5'-phosphate oxidase family protein [Lachnospiraceae bacterium]
MRRSDREITDKEEMFDVIRHCDVCRLGLVGEDGLAYIVPLNFAPEFEDGRVRLYFHSALEGLKMDLIKQNPRVSFEMDCDHRLVYRPELKNCTFCFRSVMGSGLIRFPEEGEKKAVMEKLMRAYHDGEALPFNEKSLAVTAVYCLEVTAMTGKKRLLP